MAPAALRAGPGGGRRRAYLPARTWTDLWIHERVRGPRWVQAEHDLDTMRLYLREGAVIPMGPVVQRMGERPTDPLTVVVAPFEKARRTEVRVPVDGHEVEGHPGQVVLDAPPGVELRR
jgi:alpha-glucosidase (family GH31 glycosyl hydrolase)